MPPDTAGSFPLGCDLFAAGIVCFKVEGLSPRQVVDALDDRGVVGSVTPYDRAVEALA